MESKKVNRKVRTGVVVSDKMEKTIVVRVDRMAKHSLYGKPVLRSKKFMAHDEANDCRIGDKVMIAETRPLSTHKRWEVTQIIERAPILGVKRKTRRHLSYDPASYSAKRCRQFRREEDPASRSKAEAYKTGTGYVIVAGPEAAPNANIKR